MKAHNLKLDDKYFDDVKNGSKNFEIRKYDRNYQVGDFLFLHRFNDDDYVKLVFGGHTGSVLKKATESTSDTIIRKITYIERDYQIDGYVTLGLAPVEE